MRITAEMSRLGRSVGHIAILVDELQNNGVRLIFIKENMELNGRRNMQSKVMVTMFSLFAKIERGASCSGGQRAVSADPSWTARKGKSANTSHEV